MTKKLKVCLMLFIAAVCLACLSAGCKIGLPDRSEVISSYKGAYVVYYGNGGSFDSGLAVREVYFKKDNVPFYEIPQGSGGSGVKVGMTGYDLIGWYAPQAYAEDVICTKESGTFAKVGEKLALAGENKYVTTNAEGMTVPAYPVHKRNSKGELTEKLKVDNKNMRPVYFYEGGEREVSEADVRLIPDESKPYTADYTLVKAECNPDSNPLVVCAKWEKALHITYKLICNEGDSVKNSAGETVERLGTLCEDAFGNKELYSFDDFNGNCIFTPFSQHDSDKHVVAGVYEDEDCKVLASQINRADYSGVSEIVRYVKYLPEGWKVIISPGGLRGALFSGKAPAASDKYYIQSDLDFTNFKGTTATNTLKSGTQITCTIDGGGATLKNMYFPEGESIFGALAATAKISNIRIETLTCGGATFTACASVAEGAQISAVINGKTVTAENAASENIKG